MKKFLSVILSLALLVLTASGCTVLFETDGYPSSGDAHEDAPAAVEFFVKEINKHGIDTLDTDFDKVRSSGLDLGDIITVSVGENVYEFPLVTAFSDVDSGDMLLRFDLEDNQVVLGINYGSFAERTGLAVKEIIEENPGYRWIIAINSVSITLKEKGGYLAEYNFRNLSRTNDREDYFHLSDEEFANFRAAAVTGLKENLIYRSSSPIEPAIGRNEYAMTAMESAGIVAVINLDDSVETMNSYETFAGSYYASCNIINPEVGYDFLSEEFPVKVKECLTFIIENDGPYLVHCKEGKDRTGMICAIIECFVGATAEEVASDYMLTYYNYFGVEKGSALYETILSKNLVKTLTALFGVEDLYEVNLQCAAEEYLLSIGFTSENLASLYNKLAKE